MWHFFFVKIPINFLHIFYSNAIYLYSRWSLLKLITFLMPPSNGPNAELWMNIAQPARTCELPNPLMPPTLLSMKMKLLVFCKVLFPFQLNILSYQMYCLKSINNKRLLYSWKNMTIKFDISLPLFLLSVLVFKEVTLGSCVRLVIVLVLETIMLHLFPKLSSFWFSEKKQLCKFHVSGTVRFFK